MENGLGESGNRREVSIAIPQALEKGRGRRVRKESGRGLRKGTVSREGPRNTAYPCTRVTATLPKQTLELLTHKIISGCVTACGIVLVLY